MEDNVIINDERTIDELPWDEYIEKIKDMEAPYRPHPSEIK